MDPLGPFFSGRGSSLHGARITQGFGFRLMLPLREDPALHCDRQAQGLRKQRKQCNSTQFSVPVVWNIGLKSFLLPMLSLTASGSRQEVLTQRLLQRCMDCDAQCVEDVFSLFDGEAGDEAERRPERRARVVRCARTNMRT